MALKEGKKFIRKNNDFQDFSAEEFGSIYIVRNQIITKKRKKKKRKKGNMMNNGRGKERTILTLISLNGMSKLFSSFESNPKMRDASLKFLLVAANAFMVGLGTVQRPKFRSDLSLFNSKKEKIWLKSAEWFLSE